MRSLVVRSDGLTVLLLFPHPALLHIPLPFPEHLPDPQKLSISDESLSVELGESPNSQDDIEPDLTWNRALGIYCLILPGGKCFVLSPPTPPVPHLPDSFGASSISLPRGSISEAPRGGHESAAWVVKELVLLEEVRGGVGKSAKVQTRAVKAELNGRLSMLAVGSTSYVPLSPLLRD